jgi:hypothetical protein
MRLWSAAVRCETAGALPTLWAGLEGWLAGEGGGGEVEAGGELEEQGRQRPAGMAGRWRGGGRLPRRKTRVIG